MGKNSVANEVKVRVTKVGTGRKGWEWATRTRGYRFGYVTMVKSLS
jgi:hypothetical protein